jgi:hypothetical protein
MAPVPGALLPTQKIPAHRLGLLTGTPTQWELLYGNKSLRRSTAKLATRIRIDSACFVFLGQKANFILIFS